MKKTASMPRTQAWLNGSERARLQVLEVTIERGARMFIEMGKALAEIRESRLYRESHETFESYCKERWGFGASRARQLMAAIDVTESVTSVTLPAPSSESVARELGRSENPEEVWADAVDQHGPKPTAAQVREIRAAAPDGAQHASSDTRFELIDDAVALLRLLPDPDEIVFPEEAGDLDVVTDALAWMADWLPRTRAALKRHVAEQRRRPRAVA